MANVMGIDRGASKQRDERNAAPRTYHTPTLTKGPALAVVTAQLVVVSQSQDM
jgi:hypothetical protein